MGWLWNLIEYFNAMLFSLRYGKKLKDFAFLEKPEGYEIVAMRDISTEKMGEFFSHQPEEAFTYFRPHGFDLKSIKRLQGNKAFLAYVL